MSEEKIRCQHCGRKWALKSEQHACIELFGHCFVCRTTEGLWKNGDTKAIVARKREMTPLQELPAYIRMKGATREEVTSIYGRQVRSLTAHKTNGLNEQIEIIPGPAGNGGAPVVYGVHIGDEAPHHLQFMHGFMSEPNGLSHEVLLAILIDRLECFQNGVYSCRENALALTKLQEALFWLNERTRERSARGVENTPSR